MFGIISLLIINTVDYKEKFDGTCMDCDNDFGFPIKLFQSGSIMHVEKILWLGLLADLIVFIIPSLVFSFMIYLHWNKNKNRS